MELTHPLIVEIFQQQSEAVKSSLQLTACPYLAFRSVGRALESM